MKLRPLSIAPLVLIAATAACTKNEASRNSPTAPTNTVRTVALTATPSSLPAGGGEASITATVTSGAGSPMAGQQVTFTTTAGTLNPTTPVTTDAQGQAKVTLTATGNATVRATVSGVTSPDLALSVKAFAELGFTVSKTDPETGEEVTLRVDAKRAGAAVAGNLTFDTGEGTIDVGAITGTASAPYKFTSEGGKNVSARLEESDGSVSRETVRVEVKRGFGSGGDDIDARAVRWFVDCDVSGWPIEERVRDVFISRSEICVDYTGRGSKPTFPLGDIRVDATLWVFAQFGGTWYGATWDHLRPGSFCKAENAESLGSEQIMRAPMDASWVPRTGDRVGFMVSGGYVRRECRPMTVWRTNIKLITWP